VMLTAASVAGKAFFYHGHKRWRISPARRNSRFSVDFKNRAVPPAFSEPA
jgi:hypothetical protein